MTSFPPIRILHVDLADGLPERLELTDDRDVLLVVWSHGVPLGARELAPDEVGGRVVLAETIARMVTEAVGDRLLTEGFVGRLPDDHPNRLGRTPALEELLALTRPLTDLAARAEPPADAPGQPTTSVVVCTRDRPEPLRRLLHSLRSATVAPDEIVVVDNAPRTDATRAVVAEFSEVRYVLEPRAGLSTARNAGIRHTTGEVVAFTDDDIVVHPDWLEWLLRGFVSPEVQCVTGLILPGELDTPAQVVFEKVLGGYGRGYQRVTFDQTFFASLLRYGSPVWFVGGGGNMALRREAFDRVGGFDERLGAGAAGCSEDSELWYRLLARGWHCRYEPAAVVFHHHRREGGDLRSQSSAYMEGHLAALFVQFSRFRHSGNLYRAFRIIPLHLLGRLLREFTFGGSPSSTLMAGVRGYLRGLRHLRFAVDASDSGLPRDLAGTPPESAPTAAAR